MISAAKKLARRILPDPIANFLRGRRVEWQFSNAVRAFRAVSTNEPIAFYSIGARNGADSVESYFRRRRKMKLVGFEPEPTEAAKLRANGTFDHCLPFALGQTNGEQTLHITKSPGCSSIRKPHAENLQSLCIVPDWFRVERQIPIPVCRLDDAVAQYQLPPPDTMEIDVQGYEFEVLEGCGELLDGVASLSIELRFQPFYQDERLFSEIHGWLFSRGFHLAQLKRGLWGDTLVEVDACFFNRALVEKSPRAAATVCYWADRYKWHKRRFI